MEVQRLRRDMVSRLQAYEYQIQRKPVIDKQQAGRQASKTLAACNCTSTGRKIRVEMHGVSSSRRRRLRILEYSCSSECDLAHPSSEKHYSMDMGVPRPPHAGSMVGYDIGGWGLRARCAGSPAHFAEQSLRADDHDVGGDEVHASSTEGSKHSVGLFLRWVALATPLSWSAGKRSSSTTPTEVDESWNENGATRCRMYFGAKACDTDSHMDPKTALEDR